MLEGVFARCIGEWDGFGVEIDALYNAGDTVVAVGRYVGTHKETGQSQRTQIAHIWSLSGGSVVRFQQHADTLHVARVSGVV